MTIPTPHPAAYTHPMRPRYRTRTWLRGHLPDPLAQPFPKGTHDCGQHEWYRADHDTDRCYHCTIGERQHVPTPLHQDSPEFTMLAAAAAQGSTASERVLVDRLHETDDALRALSRATANVLGLIENAAAEADYARRLAERA
jgi:hypothetical protein